MRYPISAGPRCSASLALTCKIFPSSLYISVLQILPTSLTPSVPLCPPHSCREKAFFLGHKLSHLPLLLNVSPYLFTLVTLKLGTSSSKPLHLDPEIASPHLFLAALLCPTPLVPFSWPVPCHLHSYLKDVSAPTVISLSCSPLSPTLP